MNQKNQSRRNFLQTSAKAAATSTFVLVNRNVMGANDAIRIGSIGCGGRGTWHIGWIHRSSQVVPAKITAVCDVWDKKRDAACELVEQRFEQKPAQYKHYEDLLANPDIDAVVIATPDHQHSPQLIDAVQAGKDVYVEKPITSDLKILNKAYDVVTKSDRIVQSGSQGRSSKGALAAKRFIQEGKIGKVLRIEESRSAYNPYWNYYEVPSGPDVTDWNAFQMGLPKEPFNADQHGHWMGYSRFSPNTIGGWMSHLSDFVHFLTDCGMPQTAVAHGGIYSPTSDLRRTCPDTVTAIVDYAEGFSTLFTTHFGNGANNYTTLFGTKGAMQLQDPDGNVDGLHPRVSGEGSEHPERLPDEYYELDEIAQDDHMVNWLKCILSREQPNANMKFGYMQGVAVLLADQARIEERKMRFDEKNRRIVMA
ncbi:Gfo/Idh/MocA family oxidoreductase [bacterium]|nr:Gfo/Idh/MocA family oxidoreductase [bacterium]